ncbi:MAG: hypothetical protein MR727_04165 [Lentisphaeria bacterium]|nr:hypothetical protein [Lentisphaeria bacterium]
MKKIILLLAAPILISAAEPVTVQPVRSRAIKCSRHWKRICFLSRR